MNGKDLEGLYEAYVRQKIAQGLRYIEAGRTPTEEDFDQRMARWLEPCNSSGPKGRPS